MSIRTNKRILSNGLRVLLTPLEQTQAVTVLLLTKVGSRYETARINGVSHFLEHMMFKGTERRPTARDVSKELDRVGADYNAFTSKDTTGYYVKLASEHLDLALDIIADMLWHSKFAADEISRERNVIIEEINMYHDNPMMLLEDLFEELVFGSGHPLGRHISGPKEVIATMERDTIVSYFRRHYFPKNMVLSIAGNIKGAATLDGVRTHFGRVSHARTAARFKPFRLPQRAPRITLHHRETEQVQLGLGFPALSYDDPNQAALAVLAVILGGNMSSRLFTRVREQQGLCYHISASRNPYQDTGTLLIRSGLDKDRIEPALKLILKVVRELLETGVTDEEVAHGKEFLRGKFTLGLEDSEEIADYFAKQELLVKKPLTPAERLAAIARVRPADVMRIARAVLQPERTNLALIGPFKNATPFLRTIRSW
ncbi:MAG: insulinase family protein [Candidatus Kerfeldbacteria bacterium]|nr:insulinase family protein [Candidatus Kerfeldbacteria bacterium]